MSHVVRRCDNLASSQIVQQISPQLNHPATLVEMRRAVIAAAQFLIGHMGQMPLDDLAVPSQQFAYQRTGSGPETVPP